jgi:hypothetical protein
MEKTMRDYLLDLVEHSYDLGCIDLIKITGTDKETTVDGLAENKSVVMQAKFATPVAEFIGTFGMPNLSKLKILLNLQEYKEDAQITVLRQDRNGVESPVGLHFENKVGDFKNDYRFMVSEIVNDKLKTAKMKPLTWHVEFEPTVAAIQRLKMQAQANAEEPNFMAKTENGDLKFYFGDHSTHAGNFVFHPGTTGKLARSWLWPVSQFIAIMNLTGDKTVRISDDGAAKITVDSGIAVYEYILPALSK